MLKQGKKVKRSLSRFIPGHFKDPLGLAVRVLRSGGEAGRFALLTMAMRLTASPLDIVLERYERRRYENADSPRLPIVIVCGPPRSGTSLVAATLIRFLPVAYVNNLMAIFPRSPLMVNRLFGSRQPRNDQVDSISHYGRTRGLHARNDGLFLWDRWLGADRTALRVEIADRQGEAMRCFWGAFQEQYNLPIITKNNNLNVHAKIVADWLPTAHFICMQRDPLYLAQSLLKARQYIHGDATIPYGIYKRGINSFDTDPIEDVCRQVEFYENIAREQRELVGPERFWLMSYEEFCNDPGSLVLRVAKEILGISVAEEDLHRYHLPKFIVNNNRSLPESTFSRLRVQLQKVDTALPRDRREKPSRNVRNESLTN